MLKIFIRFILLSFVLQTSAFADEIEITGTVHLKKPAQQTKQQALFLPATNQSIALLRMDLSGKAQQTLADRIEKIQHAGNRLSQVDQNLPKKIQLNMNGIPVLNQGSHGTCVSFAISAAIDAVMDKGDYISQLCQLELGTHLEKNSYTSSGWAGSWGRIILSQMDVFGIVSKGYQRSVGCSGLNEYPLSGEDPSVELSLSDYHQISEALPQNLVAWSSILEVYQVSSDEVDEEQILAEIKKALVAGDRLTFGILLLDFDQGLVGAVGSHHEKYDTWVLTPEIAQDINDQAQFAGHAMIITGYDDDAIAQDNKGRTYRGLLTLRNSWGANIGDQGNFYMTYDYFKALMLEVQRIRHLN